MRVDVQQHVRSACGTNVRFPRSSSPPHPCARLPPTPVAHPGISHRGKAARAFASAKARLRGERNVLRIDRDGRLGHRRRMDNGLVLGAPPRSSTALPTERACRRASSSTSDPAARLMTPATRRP